MIKKLTMLAMAVGALVAFAVPAAASATPLIHDEKGEPVNHVTAVSENTISVTNLGTLECSTVELTIEVTENTTTTAHGHGDGAAFGTPPSHEGPCLTEPLGLDVHINRVEVNTIHLNDDGTGSATFEFDFVITGVTECTVGGDADVSYVPGSSTLSIDGDLKTLSGGPLCPDESSTISGDFDLQPGVTVGSE